MATNVLTTAYSLAEALYPRRVITAAIRYIRGSFIAKVNIVQTILVIYWTVIMLNFDWPRHNWTFILSGISILQSLSLVVKPQCSAKAVASNFIACLQMAFIFVLWLYAIHWSFTEARRVRKWQVECIEYYPINLDIRQDQLVLQSMISAPIISFCQLIVFGAYSLPTIFDSLEAATEFFSSYRPVATADPEG